MKDFFFQVTSYKKEHGFDSYSKDAIDIINFYNQKYPEVSNKYKNVKPLSKSEFLSILQIGENNSKNKNIGLFELRSTFEKYIVAFLWAMNEKYEKAEYYFLDCYNSLDNSFSAKVNKIFILLQIAQLYERMGSFDRALKTLQVVYKTFYYDKELSEEINNFYASCCVSIGLLYYRIYKYQNIAGAFFNKSISLRMKYKQTYPKFVFENYISMAYRYVAQTYYDRTIDKYIYLKQSYILRSMLLNVSNDEFTKKEFSYLSVDFVNFLITNNFKIGYVNKISNNLYKVLALLKSDSKNEMAIYLTNACLVIAKYYYIKNEFYKFYKWYALLKYFKYEYHIDIDESFLGSEKLYSLLKF